MKATITLLLPVILLSSAFATASAQSGTCGICPSPGSCPPTSPLGAGPGEDHRCEDLSGIDLVGVSMPSSDLSFANITNTDFRNANVSGVDFSNVMGGVGFSGANFFNANLVGADFTDADLPGVGFPFANLTNANFSGADLSGASFTGTTGSAFYDCYTSFPNPVFFDPIAAGWTELPCWHCGSCPSPGFCSPTFPMGAGPGEDHGCENHFNANLTSVNLSNAFLSNAQLGSANLSSSNLANANLENAALSSSILLSTDLTGANLSFANLTGANLTGTDLTNADLSNALLLNADLSQVDAINATLTNAVLAGASLINANFPGVNLSNANLAAAVLANTVFNGADFTNVNFQAASVSGASFSEANLSGASNLNTTTGIAFYNCGTDFGGTGFDPIAQGWVNLSTCGACVQAAAVTRVGSPANPNAFFSGQSDPQLGQTWRPFIDHAAFAPSAFVDFVGISLQGSANTPTGLGTLLILPPFLSPITFNGTPGTPFAIQIPNDCAFLGRNVWTQGGSVSLGPVIELANALDLVLGNQ